MLIFNGSPAGVIYFRGMTFVHFARLPVRRPHGCIPGVVPDAHHVFRIRGRVVCGHLGAIKKPDLYRRPRAAGGANVAWRLPQPSILRKADPESR